MNTSDSPASSPAVRLLIVDDNPSHMTALYHTLEDAGYDVTAFPSATQALQALHSQPFDLIMTDLQMPEMDGISFLRHAQEIDQNVVGIVMTGHGAIDTAIEAMKAGALDYVLKPFKLSTILPVLSRALEVRRLRMEIMQLQQRVREHVVELEAANRELETFSYSVSHDLRAPLRAISGLSNILVESYSTTMPGEAQQLLQRIISSAERMGQLIEHLLRFARLSKQSLTKRPISMDAMVRQVLEDLQKELTNRHVAAQVGELPDVVGDPVLLQQVFVNLLSNAFKFTRHSDHPEIVVGCQQGEGEQIYFVRDNGAGFDMQYAGNLFKVFHRLHSADEFEGTGVGLSLVQRIVQRHGGRIWAEGEVGKGATFYFTLPQS
jgi:two-component system sensor histidine kinase/response regulator